MNTVFKTVLYCILLFITPLVFAQQTVGGTVTDAASGEPLPGVNVIVKGTSRGVTSDFDGNYQISASQDEVLVFSYLGYSSQEIAVSSLQLNVTMSEDLAELEEVVVIGYGEVRKKDLTGAVDLVGSDDFSEASIVSAQQLIQGKVAGVSVVTPGGAPGEGAKILIRGVGSLNLSSDPLYVVDGVPLDNGGIGGSRNVLNIINPNDIASISILKDASASAIYGSRAANGVVMITTKKGAVSDDLTVELNTRTTFNNPTDYVDVLTAQEFKAAIQATGDAASIALLGSDETDWQKEIYRNAITSDTNLTISGGIEGVPVRLSYGNTKQEGILKNDSFNRNTFTLNLRPTNAAKTLRLDFNTRAQFTNNSFGNRGAIGSAISFDPTKPVFDSASPYNNYYTWLKDGRKLSLSPTNPLALIDLTNDESTVRRFIVNGKLDYDLPSVKDLTATVSVSYDRSKGDGVSTTDKNIPTDEVGFNGSRNTYSNLTTNKLMEAYLNYKLPVNAVETNITAGYSYQSFEYDNISYNSKEILNADGSINSDNSIEQTFDDRSKNVLLSYFGRANLNYQDRLLLTATLRADASSKLNPNDRWGYFPSVALAWNLHNESFLNVEAIDQLKLRVGYGELGNVNGLGDYTFLTRYTISNLMAQYGFGSNFYRTYRPSPINKDLRWEIGNTLNAGIDFSLFNNRLSGSVNAYLKKTKDLIATAVTDPFTNFGSTIPANIGDMENKGIEFELTALLANSDDLSVSLTYNMAYNKNTITRLENIQAVGDIAGGVGNKIQRHEVGKAPYAFYVFKQIYDAQGKPIEGSFADLNNDGVISLDDRYFYKDPYADMIMGTTLNVRYKNFDLSVAGRASFGNYVYNNGASTASIQGAMVLERLGNQHASYLDNGFQNISVNNLLSDHFIENASFFRLDNITLGYNFKKARLYVTADNLALTTNYSGIDPEITGGIDNNFYPRSTAISAGINYRF